MVPFYLISLFAIHRIILARSQCDTHTLGALPLWLLSPRRWCIREVLLIDYVAASSLYIPLNVRLDAPPAILAAAPALTLSGLLCAEMLIRRYLTPSRQPSLVTSRSAWLMLFLLWWLLVPAPAAWFLVRPWTSVSTFLAYIFTIGYAAPLGIKWAEGIE
jgi:hypothetical protein